MVVETSPDIIKLMRLGTDLTRRPDLVVIGITFGWGFLSDSTGCLSATVVGGMVEAGFAGTRCSGASNILCHVGPFAVTATFYLFPG